MQHFSIKYFYAKFKNTSNITYCDQISITSEMQVWLNICKSINLIHFIKRLKDKNHVKNLIGSIR